MHRSLNYLPAATLLLSHRKIVHHASDPACDAQNRRIRPTAYLPILPVLFSYTSDAVAVADRRAAVAAITKKSLALVHVELRFGQCDDFDLEYATQHFYNKDFPMRGLNESAAKVDLALLDDCQIIFSYGTVVSKNYYGIKIEFEPCYNYPTPKNIIEMVTRVASHIISDDGGSVSYASLVLAGISRVGKELIELIRSAHVQQHSKFYSCISWGDYRPIKILITNLELSRLVLIHKHFAASHIYPT